MAEGANQKRRKTDRKRESRRKMGWAEYFMFRKTLLFQNIVVLNTQEISITRDKEDEGRIIRRQEKERRSEEKERTKKGKG